MNTSRKIINLALVLSGCAMLLQGPARAAISINVGADNLKDAGSNSMSVTGLVILVASTTNSQFGVPTATSFVSGDDIEIARFDLSSGDYAGQINAAATSLSLSGNWNAGDPLAIYWFPTLTTNALAPGNSTPYGFYTGGAGLDGSDPWFTPADGNGINLLFLTKEAGGSNSNDVGQATSTTPAAAGGATTLALASSVNPALPGSNVTFTAAVSVVSPGTGTPTGNVIFKDGTTSLATISLNGSGVATLNTSSLSHGSHALQAEYAGNGSFSGSTNTLNPAQVINAPPLAASDAVDRVPTQGAKIAVKDLLANDSDPDSDPVTLSGVNATSAHGGTVTLSAGWIHYTPPAGFTNSDSFSYTIADSLGGTTAGTVAVNVRINSSSSQNVSTQNVGGDSIRITGSGIPGRTYTIQYTENLETPDWQTLGTRQADTTGWFEFVDSPPSGSPPRFYRSTYP